MSQLSRSLFLNKRVSSILLLLILLFLPLFENDLGDFFASFFISGIYFTCMSFSEKKRIVLTFFSLLFYNFINLFWLFNTTYYFQVALLIILLSLLYIWPFLMVYRGKYINGIFTWVSVDFVMLHVDVGFPLISLSHHLAFLPEVIQFSKYFGSLGINLFVLLLNVGIIALKNYKQEKIYFWIFFSVIVFIQALNLNARMNFSVDKRNAMKVLAINTDLICPSEKYSKSTQQLYNIYEDKIKSAVSKERYDLIVLPETSFDSLSYIDQVDSNLYLSKLHELSPNSNIIVGSVLYQKGFLFENLQPNGLYKSGGNQLFFMNSSIFISNNEIMKRHKNKLVPFNEYVPNGVSFLMPTIDIIDFRHFKLVDTNTKPFKNENLKVGVGICYESLFGEFISQFVLSGANLLVFQYNEGWYHSLFGARKMLANAALRANEQNKFVVSSSNCGFSAIIASNGKVLNTTSENVDLIGKIYLNAKITPYSFLGDIIGWIAVLCILILFIKRSIGKDANTA